MNFQVIRYIVDLKHVRRERASQGNAMTSPSKIICRVRVDDTAKSVEFTWSEGSASFKPYALVDEQVADFRVNVRTARERLFGLVQHHERPVAERDHAGYRQACLDLAEVGHSLYNQIFDPSARDGGHVDEIAGWLRDITGLGEVEAWKWSVTVNRGLRPWNVVYDEEPATAADKPGDDDSQDLFTPFLGEYAITSAVISRRSIEAYALAF